MKFIDWQYTAPDERSRAVPRCVSLILIQRYRTTAKRLFVIAANCSVFLSHQQFQGQVLTCVYFLATGTE